MSAQVHELWRTGLTNTGWGIPPTNFATSAAAVDVGGNTLVSGVAMGLMAGIPPAQAFVAKFSPSGQLSWMYLTGERAWNGVESLALGPAGQIVLVTRLTTEEPQPITLIVVSPDGQELWRVEESNAVGNSVPVNSVAVDDSGNILWYGLRRTSVPPENFTSEMFVSKFASTGQKLWRLTLPQESFGVPLGGLGKAICMLPDGAAAVTGGYATGQGDIGGFVAKISRAGELLWFVKPMLGSNLPIVASSTVKAGTNGTIWAVGPYRFSILGTNGELLRFGTLALGAKSATSSFDGGFLLDQFSGAHYLRLDPEGQIRWRTSAGLRAALGAAEDDDGGFLAAGADYGWPTAGLVLDYIDAQGNMQWSFPIQDTFYDPWPTDTSQGTFLRAPDGTYRVVLNETTRSGGDIGIAIIEFGLDNSPLLPRIIEPPAPVSWDGTNDVHFSVAANEDGPLRYQWFLMGYSIADATNSTLTSPASAVPSYRGFIHVRVDDTNGYALSRAVNLHCGRIWLNIPMLADLAGQVVSFFSDIDVPCQIERSTNLVTWEPVPGTVESYGYGMSADIPSQGGAFYRAAAIPFPLSGATAPAPRIPSSKLVATQRK